MSQYKTGTATVTNNSPTVTGTNTLWLANVTAGDSFTVAGDGVMYDVASVDSDTEVTLSVAYSGVTASGVVYTIARDFTSPDNFPELTTGDIETPTIITRALRKIQSKFTAIVSDLSGKADQATTYTETEVDTLLDDKADIAGQTFTGDIAAPKITASTGILFGTDTAATNTLDDYEEGTWTPAISGLTLSSVGGSYTKIGNKVFFTFDIEASSATATSGDLKIGGLPFQSSSIDTTYGTATVQLGTMVDVSAQTTFGVHITESSLTLDFFNSASRLLGNSSGILITGRIVMAGQYTV